MTTQPTEAQLDHEFQRINEIERRNGAFGPHFDAAIMRRARSIRTPWKLYTFFVALEAMNMHRLADQVRSLYIQQFGQFPRG